MFLTETEILDTPHALALVCQYFEEHREQHKAFFAENVQKKFVFMGCGSSYMLAKSAAAVFGAVPDTAALAVPAGDYLVAPKSWNETLRNSIVVTFSRSGRTSELVRAVKEIRGALGCPVISVCAKQDNDLTPLCDLSIGLDWCYDRSVCQTRTVTSFYTAALLLAAVYADDRKLAAAVHSAAAGCGDFQRENRAALEKISALPWNNVVVLADGPLCGIAEEGALAFTEISMLCGRYFHVLDYRHGPIVISDENTLTVMVLRPGEETLQRAMAADVLAKGGPLVTVSDRDGNPWGGAVNIQIREINDFAAWGMLFIYVCQVLALQKAIREGGNPDQPDGLDPYIRL
ncbi:MAG: SIS domain-containing protein [Eubacteriales bacterium]|nr:SIS domain-containing protein [Eubacteriales bacterium]